MNDRRHTVFHPIKAHRRRKGWTQTQLGQKLGIGRQGIYDLESGRYLPNTAIALQLADLFGCSVESLFRGHKKTDPSEIQIVGDLCPASGIRTTFRLALAHVRKKLVGVPLDGFPPSSFGLASADAFISPGKSDIIICSPPEVIEHSLLVLGCNPALDILESHVKRRLLAARLRCLFASSRNALAGIEKGAAHIAATHFHDENKIDGNIAMARKSLPNMPSVIIGFSRNEEGLMIARGNPLGIRGVEDLARPGLRFANREPGAALRRLLDAAISKKGIGPEQIEGYENMVHSHTEGAYRVVCGSVDAALGLRVVAEQLGLAFLPLQETRCDLVIPADLLELPAIDALLQALCSARLRQELNGLPGYDSGPAGQNIGETSPTASVPGA